MNAERLRQIKELYHSARECEPGERSAFLAEACRGDEELRRKVELLLAQDASNDDAAGETEAPDGSPHREQKRESAGAAGSPKWSQPGGADESHRMANTQRPRLSLHGIQEARLSRSNRS